MEWLVGGWCGSYHLLTIHSPHPHGWQWQASESVDAARKVVLLRTQCMGAVNDFIVLSHRRSHELVMTCARMLLIDAHENGRVVLPANTMSALIRCTALSRESMVCPHCAVQNWGNILRTRPNIFCDETWTVPPPSLRRVV